jgi:(2S)-methylsuccinyl-CoA dehydrogenase
VFEHPGEQTFPVSCLVVKRGGMVVFCAGTTGYNITFDARYVWMRQKRIQGSHFANLKQASGQQVRDRPPHRSVHEREVFPWAKRARVPRDSAVRAHQNVEEPARPATWRCWSTRRGRARVPHLLAHCEEAVVSAEGLLAEAKAQVRALLGGDGKVAPAALDREQRAAHGLAWIATYVEALRQMVRWARGLEREKRLGEIEILIVQAAFGEYLAQLAGGIAMSQNEIVRPSDLGIDDESVSEFLSSTVKELIALGTGREIREGLAEQMSRHASAMYFGDPGLDDTMSMVREQFYRFAQEKIAPCSHQWHLKDELIPLEIIAEMSALGVFGLTIPEEYGGSGLSKTAMCVVSEELSRGYIGVGSLGTRSEIAAELILSGGTTDQRSHWLPLIARGEKLPTAVFTEPNTGSDLGSLATRAVREGDVYKVFGNKTWITHAARADLMTLLVRTDPKTKDYRGPLDVSGREAARFATASHFRPKA